MTIEEMRKCKISAEHEIIQILRTLELNLSPARITGVSVDIVVCSTFREPQKTHVGRVSIEVVL